MNWHDMITKILIRKLFTLLIVAVGLVSCSWEVPVNTGIDPVTDPIIVTLEMRVSGNSIPATRALGKSHEEEVSEVVVFLFEKGTELRWDTALKHVGRSVGEPQETGASKQFSVELYSGEWDLWVLGNAQSLIDKLEGLHNDTDIYSEAFIALGLTKSDLQAELTKTVTGKWPVDPTGPSGVFLMPMWGMADAVLIDPSSPHITQTINLYRMLVKIDVEVQREADTEEPELYPGIPLSQFELTYVSLHNYTTSGRLVPGLTAEDGDWINSSGGFALRTSLPEAPSGVYGWESNKRLEWSDEADFTTAGTALNGVIYTLEADSGTQNTNRPCLIIGGRYNGDDDITYYRADFLDKNKSHLDLLRNHRYTFLIRKIGGVGSSTIQDAYEAGPTNLEAQVVEWNEGGYLDGVWNGAYEIRFSGRSVHFNQFGEPDHQVLKVRSNVPTLTFDDFANITAGPNDQVWTAQGDNRWSNNHFSLQIDEVSTLGGYTEYTLTFEALPTAIGDPARNSLFYVKGYMLQATIEITQERHQPYRLLTSPNPAYAIAIDGTPQRVKVEVISTHSYKIDFMEYTDMFDAVYEVPVGGAPLVMTNIPASTTELYVAVNEHTEDVARVGEFYLQHMDSQSDAPASVYSVLQMTPILLAELEEGGHEMQMPKRGGEVIIKVTSNLASWYPVLFIDGEEYEGDKLAYFNVETGVKNQTVQFAVPELPSDATSNKVYEIMFKDTRGKTETAILITITQKAQNGVPPTGGTNAPEAILAVDENGVLNLDGRGYIVFFKWGSTIAISGAATSFDASQIAWAPEEYDVSLIGDDWAKVPYASDNIYLNALPPNLPADGLGDPCRLASKSGVVGGWKMPTTAAFTGIEAWNTKTIQNVTVWGRPGNNGIFYPAAGRRLSGTLTEVMQTGYYWSSVPNGIYSALVFYFNSGALFPGNNGGRAVGHAIRCVPE